jgi:hypothetical protein
MSADCCPQLAGKFAPFLLGADDTLLQHSSGCRAILVFDTNHLMNHLGNLFLVAGGNYNARFAQNFFHMPEIAGHKT